MPGFNALQSKPPAPPTALGRLRLLSPNAAIRCSPLLFGGISLGQCTSQPLDSADTSGTAWHEYQPPTDKEKSFELLDAYVAAGGNMFDTANGYSVSPPQTLYVADDRTKKVRLSSANGWLNVGIEID